MRCPQFLYALLSVADVPQLTSMSSFHCSLYMGVLVVA